MAHLADRLAVVRCCRCRVVFGKVGRLGEPMRALQDASQSCCRCKTFIVWTHTRIKRPPALTVYWSLSLEEQFYLFLPCLLFIVFHAAG